LHNALTVSFVIYASPRDGTALGPQCIAFSLSRVQPGQRYATCSVAPRNESTSAPAIPASAIAAKARQLPCGKVHNKPIHMEPAIIAAVPSAVTPPETPGATTRKPTRLRGAPPKALPISVAHVS